MGSNNVVRDLECKAGFEGFLLISQRSFTSNWALISPERYLLMGRKTPQPRQYSSSELQSSNIQASSCKHIDDIS